MSKEKIIVFNIGLSSIGAAIFSKNNKGGIVLEKYSSNDLNLELINDKDKSYVELKEGVNALVSDLGISKGNVICVISSFSVLFKFSELPFLSDVDKVNKTIKFEAKQQFPYSLDDISWDHQAFPVEKSKVLNVLFAAIKRNDLNRIQALFLGNEGIKIKSVVPSPVALYNSFLFNYNYIKESFLILDMGSRTVDIILSKEKCFYSRVSKIAGYDFSLDISRELGISVEEAEKIKISILNSSRNNLEDNPAIKIIEDVLFRIKSEVLRTISFYTKKYNYGDEVNFKKVFISGGMSKSIFIKEYFEKGFDLPVEIINSFNNVKVSSKINFDSCKNNLHHFSDLIGGATFGLENVPVDIDFISKSLEEEKKSNNKNIWIALILFIFLTLFSSLAIYFNIYGKFIDKKLSKLKIKRIEFEKNKNKFEKLLNKYNQLSDLSEPFINIFNKRVYWVSLFDYLNKNLKDDLIFFSSLEPMYKGKKVDLGLNIRTRNTVKWDDIKIDSLLLEGFWRNNNKGSVIVHDLFNKIKGDCIAYNKEGKTFFFDLKNSKIEDFVEVDPGADGNKYVYKFKIKLPLDDKFKPVKFNLINNK